MMCDVVQDDVIQHAASVATEKVRRQEALLRLLEGGAEERQARRVLSVMRENASQALLNATLNRPCGPAARAAE